LKSARISQVTPPSVLERAKELTTPHLREAIGTLPAEIRGMVEYHMGWVDASGRPESRGGKAVRPALALLSAEAAGASPGIGIPGAVAVELIHNFSLIHDDIMDGDRERRHRSTVWALWGVGQAIIVGDALMALALQILLEREEPAAARASQRLCVDTAAMIAGQVKDVALESRNSISLEDCIEMEAKKTGALLGCASSIGAILAGAEPEVVQGLTDYGVHLGLAFQAVDDLLGIWGRPEITGKPVWNDLRQRKKSLPVAAAVSSGRPEGLELCELLANGDLSEAQLGRAVELIESCGGRDRAEECARTELAAAIASVESVPIDARAQVELTELARFLGDRDY
jgi:geranylgeranyl diphosphate synthase, type I